MVPKTLRNPFLYLFFAAALLCGCNHHHDVAVTTYHFDDLRTG